MEHVLAILGLGALTAGWFLVQRWREGGRADEPPAPAEGCGFCTHRDTCGAVRRTEDCPTDR